LTDETAAWNASTEQLMTMGSLGCVR